MIAGQHEGPQKTKQAVGKQGSLHQSQRDKQRALGKRGPCLLQAPSREKCIWPRSTEHRVKTNIQQQGACGAAWHHPPTADLALQNEAPELNPKRH